LQVTFSAVREALPGEKWARRFRQYWPAYRRWWLAGGEAARPDLAHCQAALEEHMPELLPLLERLARLAGGGDEAARFLSMYDPPPYLAGCSQAVWQGAEPLLVRNYDYDPHAFDALCLHTAWLGRRVLGLSDCMAGLLDGVNEDGLAVSLTFGGRRIVGEGFGIPIVLRYVLETCADVDEAVAALSRIPCHMAYNVTVLDKARHYRCVYISPDGPVQVTRSAVATNHQPDMQVVDHPGARTSLEREAYLLQRLTRHPGTADDFVAAFQWPPLYSFRFEEGFGTLYTAAYRPAAGALDLHWPGVVWTQAIDAFEEGSRRIEYRY
jgi:predicted choloylglycine hydrolase